MNREIHVRLCERLGARFPGPTRRSAGDRRPDADQILLSQVPRRETLGSPQKLTAGALVDRKLRFCDNCQPWRCGCLVNAQLNALDNPITWDIMNASLSRIDPRAPVAV